MGLNVYVLAMFPRPLLLALVFVVSLAHARSPLPVFTAPAELSSYTDDVLARTEAEIIAIKRSSDDAPTLLRRWDRLLASLNSATALFQLYHYGLKAPEEIKVKSEEQITRIEEAKQALNKDLDLYRVLEKSWRRDHDFADQESRELVERFLLAFEKNGVHLSPDRKAEVLELQKQLKERQGEYSSRVKAIQTASPFVVNAAKLYGLVLPPQVEVREGKAYVSVQHRDASLWFLSNVPDEALRRAYFEHVARIHEPLRPLALEMLELRRRIATKLGKTTWSEVRLPGTMLQSSENVHRFLLESTRAYRAHYRTHIDAIRSAKQDETGDERTTLKPWDLDYYTRMLAEIHTDDGRVNYASEVVDAERLFEVTFAYLEEMFDLRIERSPIDAREAHLWSGDAEVLTIYRKDSDVPLTQTYFEPYQHEGVKLGFALALDGDEPEARLAGNNRTAVFGKLLKASEGRTKLNFSEARVFFHEFGHLLHHAFG
ncbi:MAG TPA: M3 family metallopeptidase, partial [Bdellovibrionota bacterium]|nr:M3 family metallopeptidase [Bdellovibrionota bacterium]